MSHRQLLAQHQPQMMAELLVLGGHALQILLQRLGLDQG